MKPTSTRFILIALVVLIASGCSLLSPVRIETKKAIINKIPSQIPQEKRRESTLLVFVPEAESVYDTTKIAYTTQPYEIAYFHEYEWGEKPAAMIQSVLVKTLQETHYFNAVVIPPYLNAYSYALNSKLIELNQDYSSSPAMLRFAIRFELRDGAENRVIATKEMVVHEPMREKTPYAGVVSANDAAEKIMRQVTTFVLQSVE
jgi:cholesterol transport system auxiliary component